MSRQPGFEVSVKELQVKVAAEYVRHRKQKQRRHLSARLMYEFIVAFEIRA